MRTVLIYNGQAKCCGQPSKRNVLVQRSHDDTQSNARPTSVLHEQGLSRRAAVTSTALLVASLMLQPAEAIPLAPLGAARSVGGSKLTGLTVQEVKDILERDLRDGQYFVTGDLTLEVFADDCRFKDPTNDIVGLSRYKKALGILFDPQYSIVKLLDIRVTGPRQIEADWILGGYLRFPWNPRVEAFKGHAIYTLNDDGLVQTQEQMWSKSAATALQESFTPTSGPKMDIKELKDADVL